MVSDLELVRPGAAVERKASCVMSTAARVRYGSMLVVAVSVGLIAEVSLAQKIPCGTVLRELHRVERRGAIDGGDPGRIAKSLRTTAAWVEKCAAVYGRRLQTDLDARSRRELQERVWEEHESEEVGREERATEGDVVVDPVPYRDKARQRGFSRREEDWSPYQHRAWSPDYGDEWSPQVVDPHRAAPGSPR